MCLGVHIYTLYIVLCCIAGLLPIRIACFVNRCSHELYIQHSDFSAQSPSNIAGWTKMIL